MATAIAKKEKAEVILLDAEGRGINLSLFERDAYQEEGKAAGQPFYKAEMAYAPPDAEAIEDTMAAFIDKKAGKGEGDKFLNGEGGWINPFIDGNLLAKAREDKGKTGDAYKGKRVLRVKTKWNKDGVDGPGGARVFGPDLAVIGEMHGNKAEVFNGCFGKIAVTFELYDDFPRRGDKGITVYLNAFQKTRGEASDALRAEGGGAPNPFKPVAGAGTGDTGGGVRRRRAG